MRCHFIVSGCGARERVPHQPSRYVRTVHLGARQCSQGSLLHRRSVHRCSCWSRCVGGMDGVSRFTRLHLVTNSLNLQLDILQPLASH
jgi:hypothetical protein